MKTALKRMLALTLALIFALSLAACAGKEPEPEPTAAPEATAEPTQEAAAPTEAPTAAPTEEPTEQPTEAPTPEPTPAPTAAPAVELAAEDCIEIIAEIERRKDENDEFGLLYVDEIDEGWAPESFCVEDGKLIIIDHDRRPLVIELETGERSRLPFDPNNGFWLYMPLTVLDGKLVTGCAVIDLETGEFTSVVPPVRENDFDMLLHSVYVRNGECRAIVFNGKSSDLRQEGKLQEGMEYVFDPEFGTWTLARKLFYYTPKEPDEDDDYIKAGGIAMAETGAELPLAHFIGYDGEGNIYIAEWGESDFDTEEHLNHTLMKICKYSPEGDLISFTYKAFDDGRYFYDEHYYLAEDGSVYVMADYKTGVTVYKISL